MCDILTEHLVIKNGNSIRVCVKFRVFAFVSNFLLVHKQIHPRIKCSDSHNIIIKFSLNIYDRIFNVRKNQISKYFATLNTEIVGPRRAGRQLISWLELSLDQNNSS